ncbi:MAG: CCA tRNA nucleotidyltransferase [Corynebacterium sp.]|uniref:CCA tRNA nucleotidyltransferase n=1 Tax=unclassified Corynebacterium TaxID=2624378 RepID=UPI00264736C4|nr:CCA tRNA nucleotidyltransferase [Corynebacterium sp.]MDN5582339.1 CCA tRNA nucleotidyltransferase [Corynebacterium sp.]MDN5719193.1 CCA tRNA nucleotidyltransferase [Corynebacterium sp.]MDN6259048.1 CCA tRNA nucleotidyltransferase [Corynebacterium sp.]MDN6325441.1 CCA tRNA nucleotidyltransferase [Corynebacterium sp.]MDN6509103.1 CCA tRNA nucleotidyltransferase [Corynebacterium sp.]
MLATAWSAVKDGDRTDRTLTALAGAFAARGHSLYLVGGSVRDALLGRLGDGAEFDLDFTTDARPDVVTGILEDVAETVWDTGIEFGTVSAMFHGLVVEITTFRADSYDGASRNPQVTFGDTLDGDLVRRDFRCNAIALELSADGHHDLRDPLNGLDDLVAGVLDTPAAPEQSFHDDPLRMLRACRFASQLGFTVAERVRGAMTEMSGQIERITVERVATELNKLMLGAEPWTGLEMMSATGLADHVLPELPALKLTQDEHRQHKDVYAHSLQVLRNATELEGRMEDATQDDRLVLRWAALLHDIGKPDTRDFTDTGAVTFHHHEVVGARMARRRLKALKYPKRQIQDIGQLVFLHMRFHGYGEGAWTDSAVRRYVADAGDLLPQLQVIVRADCTTRNKRKAGRLARAVEDLDSRIVELREQEDLDAVRPDLDGNEIMTVLGLRPGPEVGKAWAFLKELRLDRGPMDRDEAVAELTRWWEAQQ